MDQKTLDGYSNRALLQLQYTTRTKQLKLVTDREYWKSHRGNTAFEKVQSISGEMDVLQNEFLVVQNEIIRRMDKGQANPRCPDPMTPRRFVSQ